MKKILAVLLAALMMFSTFGMLSFAQDSAVVDVVEKGHGSLAEVLAYVEAYWKDDQGYTPTVLLFNTKDIAKMGSKYEGEFVTIDSGANKGCVALISRSFFPGYYVQLPNFKDVPENTTANWKVMTDIEGIEGSLYAGSDEFKIPTAMANRNLEDNYIVFYARYSENDATSTISKVMSVFYKIIKVIFKDELANKFAELLKEFGVEIIA